MCFEVFLFGVNGYYFGYQKGIRQTGTIYWRMKRNISEKPLFQSCFLADVIKSKELPEKVSKSNL